MPTIDDYDWVVYDADVNEINYLSDYIKQN